MVWACKEWMITVWPEGCWWPKSVGDGYEGDRGWAGWMVWRWPSATEEWRWRLLAMRETPESVESPGTYVTEWVSRGHLWLALCSFGPPSHALVVITWRGEGYRYMMRLGWTVKRAQLLKIKAQLSSIWAKGCILMTVCVLSDLTWLPLLGVGRKSWYIIIILGHELNKNSSLHLLFIPHAQQPYVASP